jgi:hypothetical protein
MIWTLRHVSSPIRQWKGIERICFSLFAHTETTALARKTEQEATTMSMIVHFSQW